MSEYTAIRDVSETLITLLRREIRNIVPTIPEEAIVLISPADVQDQNIRLTLFLYNIVENPYLKNQGMEELSATQLRHPPLSLDLHYLLTVHPLQSTEAAMLDQYRILGMAMRIFYDHAILSGSILQGDLGGTDEELRITLNTITLEDLNKIWSTFPDRPYRLSVGYLITPVKIDSTRSESVERVVSKEMGYYHKISK